MREELFTAHDGERVHRPGRLRWTEESYLDLPKSASHGADAAFVGRFVGPRSIRFFFYCITALVLLYLGRSAYLQIFSGTAYAAIAEKNRLRIDVERASRGLFYDRDGRPIVQNVPEFIVTLVLNDLPPDRAGRQEVIDRVARILETPPLTLLERIETLSDHPLLRRQEQVIEEGVSYESALRLMVEERSIPGFRVETRERRAYVEEFVSGNARYPLPASMAHVVGYVGKIDEDEWDERRDVGYLFSDLIGKDALEKTYDRMLHGVHGKTATEVDAIGQERVIVRRDAPQSGSSLSLTIDLDLQRVLENALRSAIERLPKRSRRGAVGIAMDPRDGSIRALVSLPVYDNRIFSTSRSSDAIAAVFNDPDQPLFSRAIAGEYPSGSTIKPLVALAALEEGVITPTTNILSNGGIRISQWFFPDWLAGGHGSTDVKRALAESVNTFFYTIGGGFGSIDGLGVERLRQWLSKFGFGKTLGIDLPREATGLVPSPEWKTKLKNEQWYIGDTYHLSIGQGDILVTPLQIASMTAAFANGGTVWRPHIVAQETPKALTQQIGSVRNIAVVRQGLRQGVTAGSSRRLGGLPVTAAGKTGTAQWSSEREPHAWFTGWAPYENPELVLTILVEEGGAGEKTAVPIAYELFRQYFVGR